MPVHAGPAAVHCWTALDRGKNHDRELLASLLETHRGNVSHVARALATSQSQVRRLAEQLGLVPEQFRR